MDKAHGAAFNRTLGISLTKNTADRSDKVSFLFSFYCDKCGKEWQSRKVPFVSGGFTAIENEYIRDIIWAQEHREAFLNANLEAHIHFNRCPACGRWVCNDCVELDDGDLCKDCASNESAGPEKKCREGL